MLSDNDYLIISELAQLMSRDEILELYGIKADEMNDVEWDKFNRAYIDGKIHGMRYAISQLFANMAPGNKAAQSMILEYLKHNIKSWENTATDNDAKKILLELVDGQ